MPKNPPASGTRKALQGTLKALLRETVIATCLRALDTQLRFKDDESCRRREAFVSNCEVLETILIPMQVFGDEFLPKPDKSRRELETLISNKIESLIEIANQSFANKHALCPGDPYLNSSGNRMTQDSDGLPYIEANAFLISTLMHYSLSRQYFNSVPDSLKREALIPIVTRCVDQVLDCFIPGRGWSYATNDRKIEVYFTWSVIETLVDVWHLRKRMDVIGTDDRLKRLTNCLSESLASMESFLFGVGPTTRQYIFLPTLIKQRKVEVYRCLEAFIVLGVLETKRYLDMAQTLISLVANSHLIAEQRNYEVEYPMSDEESGYSTTLRDSSILPLIVRSIATVFGEYPDRDFKSFTKKARLRDPWSYLIMKDRIEELKGKKNKKSLWGPEGTDYEIYYTERVVEALISCYQYVTDPEGATPSLQLPKSEIGDFEQVNADFKHMMIKPVS